MRSFESHNAKFPVIRGETSRHLIEAGGENPGIVVPMGQWHNLECLKCQSTFRTSSLTTKDSLPVISGT